MSALVCLLLSQISVAPYTPGDVGQRSLATQLLPEQFLRGFDPITLSYSNDQVPAKAAADDGAGRLKLVPAWPGQYFWVDRRTLQFRPAEAWPALARFQISSGTTNKVLTTTMAPPLSMVPTSGSEALKPFRVVTLTFPQAYSLTELKKIISVELRALPGLAQSPTEKVSNFSLAALPRSRLKDPATYTLTFEKDFDEGRLVVVNVNLALGKDGPTLWQGRAATRSAFSLNEVRCGSSTFPVLGASTPRELALNCGNTGEQPQLIFSSPLGALSLSSLRQVVRFEPAVNDLRFQLFGNRVQLLGRFAPDTLYTLRLGSEGQTNGNIPREQLLDEAGRVLKFVTPADVYFHLGTKTTFLELAQGSAIIEAKGPQMVPMRGFGDTKVDVRIHRIDALHAGLWPFPASPLVINEDTAPPFPGEEPEMPSIGTLAEGRHLRLLGSPLISRIVDLPGQNSGAVSRFGLDLKPLLESAVGANRPGTYVVGVRRLTGSGERSWMRVQITNLSLTSVEETGRAVLFIRTLDTGAPVRNAIVRLDGTCCRDSDDDAEPKSLNFTSDGDGRVTLQPLNWKTLTRISVTSGDDTLVLSPREPLPSFARNHWAGGDWLGWLLNESIPEHLNDATLGFVFTERPIYKPGEPVFVKGWVREKKSGRLTIPAAMKPYGFQIQAPDGALTPLESKSSKLGGLEATFTSSTSATGVFTVQLFEGAPENVVARRSFKIEAYRIPIFEVLLTAPAKVRNDAPFEVKTLARYFAGGNLAHQPISWTISQRPYDWSPTGQKGFLFASSLQMSRTSSQKNSPVTNQTGELDDNGQLMIAAKPERDLDGSAKVFRFEATVTGPDNQPVTGFTEVKTLPAFLVGLKVPRFLEKATSVKAEVLALGVDEKPLKGQELRVRLSRRVWHSSLRESSFSNGEAKYQTQQEDVKVAEKTVSTVEGPLPVEFQIGESGVFVVEVFARDKLGRVQNISADLYIGGHSPQSWPKAREGVFELKPDKVAYAPGETAQVLVQSPYEKAQGLVVIEDPKGNRYEWFSVAGSQAVLPIPIGEELVPNLPLHVVLMRGRLGFAKTNDERYKPLTAAASFDLVVKPEKNLIKIDVKHIETARPGTTQEFTISLKDASQKPIGGEVTFWLVDEAVLSLAPEGSLDPLSEMLPPNRRTVSIADSRNVVLGALAQLEENPGGDGAEGDQSGKKLVRKEFKTVPFYRATLVVPESGTLVVPVQLSDDLTNFKVRAVAASGANRFGYKQSQLRVRLPVLVQPQLPRFVRLGDTFMAGGLARITEGPEGAGLVSLSVSGNAVPVVASKKTIQFKNNGVVSISELVSVHQSFEKGQRSIKVAAQVERTVDKARDAFEISLPVLPDAPLQTFSYLTSLSLGKNVLKDFPEKPREGSAQQTVVLTNQRGLLQLAASLDYLAAYPHGCLEQRMSQLAPELALGGFLQKLELETRFTPQLKISTLRILDDLKRHQDDRGFFGYWPGASGDVALTAQAVEFMVAAKTSGMNVDSGVFKLATGALKMVLRNDFKGALADYRSNQQSAAFRALAKAGILEENYLVEAFNRRDSFDAVSLADLAFTLAEKPSAFGPNLAALKSDLWDRVQFQLVNGQTVFSKIRGERSSWSNGYLGSSASTTAAVWEALLKLDGANEKQSKLRDALLSQSTAQNGFGSTHSNRRALAALGLWLAAPISGVQETSIVAPQMMPVALNGEKKSARRIFESAEPPLLELKGAPLEARVTQRYSPKASGAELTPQKNGLSVGRNLTRYPADGSAPTQHEDVPGTLFKTKVGEILEIHTRLTLDLTRHHVALTVPFAAGLEPMNPALANASSDAKPSLNDDIAATYVERLDSEVRYYFTELKAGTYNVHFRVRASSVGRFVHPPPSAELMYQEQVSARGAGLRVEVRDK
jgi:alpha-2-macroglobulin